MFKKSDLKGYLEDLKTRKTNLIERSIWCEQIGHLAQAQFYTHESGILEREYAALVKLVGK